MVLCLLAAPAMSATSSENPRAMMLHLIRARQLNRGIECCDGKSSLWLEKRGAANLAGSVVRRKEDPGEEEPWSPGPPGGTRRILIKAASGGSCG